MNIREVDNVVPKFAKDSRLGRTVAIKNVKEQHSERFKQEARSISRIESMN